jgi:hypothetical protein
VIVDPAEFWQWTQTVSDHPAASFCFALISPVEESILSFPAGLVPEQLDYLREHVKAPQSEEYRLVKKTEDEVATVGHGEEET